MNNFDLSGKFLKAKAPNSFVVVSSTTSPNSFLIITFLLAIGLLGFSPNNKLPC
jgi:hypothetical protein